MSAPPRRRRFVAEFFVVMLGVLSALVLEQIVLDWQERARLAAMHAAIDSEVADAATVLRARAQMSPCIEARLDALAVALDAPELPAFEEVGRPPYFFSSRAAWSGAAPELLSRHLGAEAARTYGEVYQGMVEFAALGQREQDVWAVLRTLESPPMPLDPTRVWRLREAIAAARNANLLSTAISQQMTARIEALLGPVPATADDALMQRAICRPLRERGVPPRTG